MSFGVSETYIFAYVGFAVVYLVASFTFVVSALRVSARLSRARQSAAPATAAEGQRLGAVTAVIEHSQKLVDYTQLSTLLPLVYIVGSMFLGSVIVRNIEMARTVNIGWVAFTAACGLASVVLTALGIRESRAVAAVADLPEQLPGKAPEALQRVGLRLGVSAALLLVVAVFTLLNLFSVLTNIDTLRDIDYLL
jgi:hypothetical protein